MKRKHILPMSLLLSLAVIVLSLSSCSSKDNDPVSPDNGGNEYPLTIKVGEAAENLDARSNLPSETQVIRQKINDNLILETEVIKERTNSSRALTTTPLFANTVVAAIIYRKAMPDVVYRARLARVTSTGDITLLVPMEDIIIDFFSLNTLDNRIGSYVPSAEWLQRLPETGTNRADVKYIMNLDNDPDFLHATVEYNYPFNDLSPILFKHPLSQVAVQLTSVGAGVIHQFNANLTNTSSHKNATIRICDGYVTDISGDQATNFKATLNNNGAESAWEEQPIEVGDIRSKYRTLIPKSTTISHELIISSIDIEQEEKLNGQPVTITITNDQLPLKAGTRYLINIKVKSTWNPNPEDVPYIQLEKIQVAKANLQYGHGKWFVGHPTYCSGETGVAGGDDRFKWNTLYPIANDNRLTAYVSTTWRDDHDPCAKLGSGWHTPTREEWMEMINYYKDKKRLIYATYPSDPSIHLERELAGLQIKPEQAVDPTDYLYLPTIGYVEKRTSPSESPIVCEYGRAGYYRLADQEPYIDGDGNIHTYVFKIENYDILTGPMTDENFDYTQLYSEGQVDREIGCAVRCVRSIPAP